MLHRPIRWILVCLLAVATTGCSVIGPEAIRGGRLAYNESVQVTGDQELPTGFNYFGSVGISYSFGSIFNQVVNARFGN